MTGKGELEKHWQLSWPGPEFLAIEVNFELGVTGASANEVRVGNGEGRVPQCGVGRWFIAVISEAVKVSAARMISSPLADIASSFLRGGKFNGG